MSLTFVAENLPEKTVNFFIFILKCICYFNANFSGTPPAFSPDYYNTHAQSAGFMSGDMVSSNDNSSTGTPVDSNAAPFSPTATVVVGLLTSLMALLTIVGNGFTLVVFALSRSLRKFGHFFVINLAVIEFILLIKKKLP